LDIESFNEYIRTKCTTQNIRLLSFDHNLTVVSHKRTSKGKKRKCEKISFKHLYDGIHPDDWLKAKWTTRIKGLLSKHLLKITTSQSSRRSTADNSQTDTQSKGEEGWAFKRKRQK
jgi:hypothetical protein